MTLGYGEGAADDGRPADIPYWLDDMELEDCLSRTTRLLYERNMRTLVMPFQDVTIREIDVARCDDFLKELAKQSRNRARQDRSFFASLAPSGTRSSRATRWITSRACADRRAGDVFPWDEITAIRGAICDWEKWPFLAGPCLDGQLGQIVEVMLGTSARIGEVLAIRVADLDLDAPVPMVRFAGTIVSRKATTHIDRIIRTPHARSSAWLCPGLRCARSVPGSAACVSSTRDAVVRTRVGTPHTTNNVHRQLRDIMDQAGIEDVTPHRVCRTAATAINDVGDPARL